MRALVTATLPATVAETLDVLAQIGGGAWRPCHSRCLIDRFSQYA